MRFSWKTTKDWKKKEQIEERAKDKRQYFTRFSYNFYEL